MSLSLHPVASIPRVILWMWNREIEGWNMPVPFVSEIMCGLGHKVCVLPGVTIGDNTVIGAGSVVNRDIPANVIAAGNPCRVIREITEEDKTKYLL